MKAKAPLYRVSFQISREGWTTAFHSLNLRAYTAADVITQFELMLRNRSHWPQFKMFGEDAVITIIGVEPLTDRMSRPSPED